MILISVFVFTAHSILLSSRKPALFSPGALSPEIASAKREISLISGPLNIAIRQIKDTYDTIDWAQIEIEADLVQTEVDKLMDRLFSPAEDCEYKLEEIKDDLERQIAKEECNQLRSNLIPVTRQLQDVLASIRFIKFQSEAHRAIENIGFQDGNEIYSANTLSELQEFVTNLQGGVEGMKLLAGFNVKLLRKSEEACQKAVDALEQYKQNCHKAQVVVSADR